MTEQPDSHLHQSPDATDSERDAFRRFIAATDERPAWSSERLMDVALDIEKDTGVRGPAWSLLKESLVDYTEWPQGRLIALVERIEMGRRTNEAGFNEMLHADD